MTKFKVLITYGQLAVFDPSLQNPFNDWTRRHLAQGFAWRPGSVSFSTISDGEHEIELTSLNGDVPISPVAIRVIEVPFHVPKSEFVEVTSIGDGRQLKLSGGMYQLRFELSPQREIRLFFLSCSQPRFAVSRADNALDLSGTLLETAKPA
jgi:hypothetical protein